MNSEQLANHMGHNIQIHREYYRLPQETVLLANMSKLLALTEKGELHKYSGKSLAEVQLDRHDTVEVDEDEMSEEEEMDEEETNKSTK